MTVGRRIILGYGVFLCLLAAVGVFVSIEATDLAKHARKAVDGHKLIATLAEKEIDVLYTANMVTASRSKPDVPTAEMATRVVTAAVLQGGVWTPEHRADTEGLSLIAAMPPDSLGDPLSQARTIHSDQARSSIEELHTVLGQSRKRIGREIMASELILDSVSDRGRRFKWGLGTVGIIGIFFALFTASRITRMLRGAFDKMDDAASRIDATSFEVSSASQALSEGASVQVSLFDDTRAHLDEMATISKKNAVNAKRADELIHESHESVEGAGVCIQQLVASMLEIARSSEETQKIVKAIDEIAFQTNLLALNAAVEAARVGEAGAGFAVVAGEVKSLAGRAAQAAQRTAELIEDTVGKVQSGSGMVRRAADSFSHIASSIASVKELMEEIAAASDKQARDIGHVSQSMARVEEITQQNASSAEASATVSEELGTQGEQMRGIVGELIAMVVGSTSISPETLETLRCELRRLIAHPDLGGLEERAHRRVLSSWLAGHPMVEAIYTNGTDGTFIYSEPPAGLPNANIRHWWQRAIAGEEYISHVYISAITQKPCCTLSFPLRDARGKVAGVLGIDLKVG